MSAVRKDEPETDSNFGRIYEIVRKALSKSANKEEATAKAQNMLAQAVKSDKRLLWTVLLFAASSAVRHESGDSRRSTRGTIRGPRSSKSATGQWHVVGKNNNPDKPSNIRKMARSWLRNYYVGGKRLHDAVVADLKREIGQSNKVIGTLSKKVLWMQKICDACPDPSKPVGKQVTEKALHAFAKEAGYTDE